MRTKQVITLIVIFTTMIIPDSNLSATGWNDYKLDIGDGYKVFRANSLDISIGKADHSIILFPTDYPDVGPVTQYQMLKNHVLTRNAGRKPRNLFKGDSFQEVDNSMEWFFVIQKETDEVLGPFDESTFQTKLKDLGITSGDWIQPKNPNPKVPFLVYVMLLMPYMVIFLVITFVYLVVRSIVDICRKPAPSDES